MNAPEVWPPTDLPGLHIDMRARPPTADYRCRCGWTDAASGHADQMAALTNRISEHRNDCPHREEPAA